MKTNNTESNPKALIFIATAMFVLLILSVIHFEVEKILRYSGAYDHYALNEPTLKMGAENAIPLIRALEQYKRKHQAYPLDLGELPASQDIVWLTFQYTYEPSPAVEKPQEYMLSFRKRWSIDDRYC